MQKSIIIVIVIILGITLLFNMVISVLYMLTLININIKIIGIFLLCITLQSFLIANFLLKHFCKEDK